MASTYSTNLALDLMANGDQSGTWGTTNNTNLGTLIEQAISGYVTQAITDGSSANTTITIPNGATGVARNMYIEMTGALTFSTTSLIVPANKKLYFIFNNTSGGFAVTVKVSGQTGVLVPNGKKVILTSNGTDIVEAANQVVGAFGVGGVTTIANGSVSAPSLAFVGATTTGFYKGTGNAIDATLNGTQVLDINASSFDIKGGLGFSVPGTSTMAAINASGSLSLTGALVTIAPAGSNPTLFINDPTKGSAMIQGGVNTGATALGDYWVFNVPTSRGLSWSVNNVSVLNAVAAGVTIPGVTTIGAASAGVGTLTINNAVQPTIYLKKTNATAAEWQIYNNGNLGFYDGTNVPLYFVGADSIFGGAVTMPSGATIGTGSNVLGLKVAYLTADSQLNSSTTLTTLSDLTVAIGAGETWLIEWKLRVGQNLEATGLGLAVDTPASATQDVFYQYIPSALDLISGVYTGPAMVQSTTTDADRIDWTAAEILYGGRAIVTVSARVTASGAGNVLIRFAQETSTATSLTVFRGSSMKAQRVT